MVMVACVAAAAAAAGEPELRVEDGNLVIALCESCTVGVRRFTGPDDEAAAACDLTSSCSRMDSLALDLVELRTSVDMAYPTALSAASSTLESLVESVATATSTQAYARLAAAGLAQAAPSLTLASLALPLLPLQKHRGRRLRAAQLRERIRGRALHSAPAGRCSAQVRVVLFAAAAAAAGHGLHVCVVT